MTPYKRCIAARACQLQVVPGLRRRSVWNRIQIVFQQVRAAEHTKYIGTLFREAYVDADNAGARIRRADECRIGLAFQPEIVREAAVALEKPFILLSKNRMAD